MNWSLKNIKQLKTTLSGIVVFIIASLFVWFDKASLAEATPFYLMGFFFLGLPDPRKGTKPPAALVAGFLLLAITGCSPQYRLNRLINKHPELKQTITDTIRFDTIITIQPRVYDLQVPIKSPAQIGEIKGAGYTALWQIINDTVYIMVETDPDTIFIEKKIPIEKTIIKSESPAKWKYTKDILYILGFLIFVLILLKIKF
jgi:hypothetical protein